MTRQQVHELIEQLGPGQLDAVGHLLEVMIDPVARSVAEALPDDEPVTEEDCRRLERGKAWFAQRGGKGLPMDDLLAERGVTPGVTSKDLG